ncbi:MAG: hypothetical protein QM528_06440, partial [Phycisphaerales bacterium]|nr:hypothetical protein [Phycisphaerales bacterium]
FGDGKSEGFVEGLEMGKAEGMEIGKAEGKIEEKKQTAHLAKQMGMPIKDIIKLTGLSEAEIEGV